VQVDFAAEQQCWEARWGELVLRLRLADGMLLCDHFGPAAQDAPVASWARYLDSLRLTRGEASVRLSQGDEGVRWSLRAWSQPDPAMLVLRLEAAEQPLETELAFVVDAATGLLRRRTTLRHVGNGPPVDLREAESIAVLLPAHVQDVVNLAGRWGAETQVQRMHLPETALLLESRAGKTGYDFAPYVALRAPGHTYVCELLWSGNWQIHVRRRPDGRVTLAGGINPWGLRHRLVAGASLELPDALLGCVAGDLNAATQRLHDYQRRHLRPDPDRPVPVQFNSWYPHPGEPPVATMKVFATTAAQLGCEVFVLDAGWYTTEQEDPAEDWWTRTGDWVVNRRLFPHGLEELSTYCRQRGLGFGIWFEPEAVSPSAVVRRTHPEWLHVIRGAPQPPRGHHNSRRDILHLGIPEARAAVRERVLAVLRATGATWMKWDFNTDLLQGGWASGVDSALAQQDPLIRHYGGVYQLQDEVRQALPELTLEMCAGGGGRFDPALLSHAHTNWMSDQTRPLMNLAIHFGSQLAHAAVECNDWLVEWPPHDGLHGRQAVDERGDLAFRTRVAMLGSFGISAPVESWTTAELAVVREHVAWYKHIARPVIHHGDQYLLTDAPPLDGQGDWAGVWYAAKAATRGVLFAFRLDSPQARRDFVLPGLDPDAQYRVRTLEGRDELRRGADLLEGLPIVADAPFRSALVSVERMEASAV
jgi:alpha-galactosidase